MKLKIKITGPKVHGVGYRPYLTELAMRLALRGFEVYNDDEEGQQVVIALVEGDEQRIAKFYNSAMKEWPQLATVDNVKSEDFADDISPLWQFASINTASQMNKAIPLLLAVKDNTDATLEEIKAVRKTTDATLEEIKAVRKTTDTTLEEIKAVRKTTDATLEEIKAVRKNTDTIPQVLEEIKGMREEIQPGYARQMQTDVRAIKERLGMH
jgi:acylphosphatase